MTEVEPTVYFRLPQGHEFKLHLTRPRKSHHAGLDGPVCFCHMTCHGRATNEAKNSSRHAASRQSSIAHPLHGSKSSGNMMTEVWAGVVYMLEWSGQPSVGYSLTDVPNGHPASVSVCSVTCALNR